MDFRIAPIAQEHVEGFRTVLDAVAKERRYLALLEAPPQEESRKFVERNISKGYPQCVALIGEKVVGWCDVLPIDRPTKAHGAVLGVGVMIDYRGRGIGTALIRATLERARAAGLTRIELTVREHNDRAIALYEKLGFAHEGLKRNAVRVDGKYENLICMALILLGSSRMPF
jgi:ribosomal protein S18 acetylase RimI-like enzyme